MKKIIIILLVILLAAFFVACPLLTDTTDTSDTGNTEPPEPDWTDGFETGSLDSAWWSTPDDDGSLAVSDANPHEGTYHARATANAADEWYGNQITIHGATSTSTFEMMYDEAEIGNTTFGLWDLSTGDYPVWTSSNDTTGYQELSYTIEPDTTNGYNVIWVGVVHGTSANYVDIDNVEVYGATNVDNTGSTVKSSQLRKIK